MPTVLARSWGRPLGLAVGGFPSVLALALGLSSCSSEATGPGLSLRLAGQPFDSVGCVLGSDKLIEDTALNISGTLRLSVVRRDPDGARFVCDAVARVPDEKLNLDLGGGERSKIDLYAEFFDENGQLAASGAYLATTLPGDGTTVEVPRLPLYQASAWSCPKGALAAGRAFHTATELRNGEVLILGGVEALPSVAPDVFGVVASAEIYDPRKGTFTTLKLGSGSEQPVARALHRVAVLSETDTTVRLAVYGGVTGPSKQPALFVPYTVRQLRLSPAGTALPAEPEILTYDIAARTLTSSGAPEGLSGKKGAMPGGAGLPGGGLAAIGGGQFASTGTFDHNTPMLLTSTTDVAGVTVRAGAPAGVAALTDTWLLAPSVTPVSKDGALVIGAAMPAKAGDVVRSVAVPLRGVPDGINGTLAAQAVAGVPATVYHTATRLGPPLESGADAGSEAKILVTGGFQVVPTSVTVSGNITNEASQPPATTSAVRLYSVADPAGTQGTVSAQTVAPYLPTGTCAGDDGHYRAAGFEAATATLSGGQVLVTGGTPGRVGACAADCEPGDDGSLKLLCVLRQSSLYDAATGMFSPAPALGVGRMGHTQTRLRDGSILVVGGLIRPSDKTLQGGTDATPATTEAEIYNPRLTQTGAADINDPMAAVLPESRPTRTGMGLANPCPRLD